MQAGDEHSPLLGGGHQNTVGRADRPTRRETDTWWTYPSVSAAVADMYSLVLVYCGSSSRVQEKEETGVCPSLGLVLRLQYIMSSSFAILLRLFGDHLGFDGKLLEKSYVNVVLVEGMAF